MRILSLLLLLGLLGGCTTVLRSGRFGADGFEHEHLEYLVRGPTLGEFLPGWTVTNFQRDDQGRPTVHRLGPDWVTRVRYDLNGDGVREDLGEQPRYDLYLQHRTHAGTLWVQTVPLAPGRDETELSVLAQLMVRAMSGTGLHTVETERVDVRERTYAAQLLNGRDTTVGGRPAYEFDLEIASVEALSLDEDARREHARLVLVRTELPWAPPGGSPRGRALHPMLMILGYANLPSHFDEHVDALDELKTRIEFDTNRLGRIREAALACSGPELSRVRFVAWAGQGMATVRSDDAPSLEQQDCIGRAISNIGYDGPPGWRGYVVFRGSGPPPPPPAETPAATEEVDDRPAPPLPEGDPEEGLL